MVDNKVVNLMRHGEVYNPTGILYGRLPGYHLSELGKAQAAETAEFLKAKQVTYLLSSPLERTQETSKIAGKPFSLPVNISPQLIESTNYFEGRKVSVSNILTTPRDWPHVWDPFTPSWGEAYTDIATRMLQAVHFAKKQLTEGEALCVSHQLPIYTVRRKIIGQVPWHDPRKRECTPASLTRLHFQGEKIVKLTYWEPGMDREKDVWEK